MTSHEPDEELKKQVSALPDSPGVYLFKNDRGDIIYIGKAVSLKSRVRSYWNKASWRERPKLFVMMPRVAKLETVLTHSEKEALLLEATLIRKHLPRYNVALKDDRRYPWLAITYDVAYPRLIMIRDPARFRKSSPKAKIFGPYVEAGAMWQTVKVLRKVFPMRQRKSPLFKDRPCMNFHIGLCLGPCQKLVSEPDYDHMVKQIAKAEYGDANLDGVFDSTDLVQVFKIGKYEDDAEDNAGWADGDWNGDGDFDSTDLVHVFQHGNYEAVDALFGS